MREEYQGPMTDLVHQKENISILSTEHHSPNYRGFLNLGGIILIVANFRLIIENILKYGFLMYSPEDEFLSIPCILTYLSNVFPISICYLIESKLAHSIPSGTVSWLQTFLQLQVLALPIVSIQQYRVHFVPAFFLLSLTLCVSMKLYSFVAVMKEARESYVTKKYEKLHNEFKAIISKYPNLVSIQDFAYFMFFPTLCFQFKYPRSERIRKTWLIKRLVEYFVSVTIMLIMIQQYITPLLKNTFKILEQEEVNYIGLLERHLKLSLPNLYLWLFLFYSGFQCWLNILAELTRFADREFYLEWWNSRTLGEYWRKWNIPVHSWLARHVYKPMVAKGYSKKFSMFFTFFLSAVAHEYLISGACRILTYWAFVAMMSQIPMIIMMDVFKSQLEKTQIGNVVFWVSFCIIGQPIAVLIYSYQAYTSIKSL